MPPENTHITGLRSLLEAETKYSGKVLDFGHLVTYDSEDAIVVSELLLVRCLRVARTEWLEIDFST